MLEAHPLQKFNAGRYLRRSNYGFVFDIVTFDSDHCAFLQDGGEIKLAGSVANTADWLEDKSNQYTDFKEV